LSDNGDNFILTRKSQKDKNVRRVILVEGSINSVVLAAKLAVGLSTGSLAIIGDAIHSLTDVINNAIAWLVVKLSSSPADREHPYGHRKFESLAVFFLASLLVVLAFELAVHAITKNDEAIDNSAWGLGIMFAVLLVNISLAVWERRWARKLNSDILLADASHTFADILTTVVVIIGWQLSAMGYPLLDRLCALGVSCLILYLSYDLFRRILPILVDEYALDPESLSEAVNNIQGVAKVNRVRSRWIGNEKSVDLVIAVEPQLSIVEAHDIANNVESYIEKQYGATDISIHIEPVHIEPVNTEPNPL